MDWEFRIIKTDEDNSLTKFSVQDCLLDSDGVLCAHSIDNMLDGDNVEEIKGKIKEMELAFNKPILGELKGIDNNDELE